MAGLSGGAHEAVIDGVTGYVIQEPKDSGAIANAIQSILASPSLRSEMGQRSRQRVESSLSYDILAQQLRAALS